MVCPRCAKQNEEEARFCAKCGLNLIEAKKNFEPKATEETQFCYRHPKEPTHLSCGRCDKPICTKCAIIGPAGPRCPDCAKSTTPFRPAAVTLGAKRTARSLIGRGPFSWYGIIIVIALIGAVLRSCTPLFNQQSPDDYYDYEQPLPEEEK